MPQTSQALAGGRAPHLGLPCPAGHMVCRTNGGLSTFPLHEGWLDEAAGPEVSGSTFPLLEVFSSYVLANVENPKSYTVNTRIPTA